MGRVRYRPISEAVGERLGRQSIPRYGGWRVDAASLVRSVGVRTPTRNEQGWPATGSGAGRFAQRYSSLLSEYSDPPWTLPGGCPASKRALRRTDNRDRLYSVKPHMVDPLATRPSHKLSGLQVQLSRRVV